jgi:hypothetical protein
MAFVTTATCPTCHLPLATLTSFQSHQPSCSSLSRPACCPWPSPRWASHTLPDGPAEGGHPPLTRPFLHSTCHFFLVHLSVFIWYLCFPHGTVECGSWSVWEGWSVCEWVSVCVCVCVCVRPVSGCWDSRIASNRSGTCPLCHLQLCSPAGRQGTGQRVQKQSQ